MKNTRMILCFVISLVMILTMSGMTAFATEGIDATDGQDVGVEGVTDEGMVDDTEAGQPVPGKVETSPEEDVYAAPVQQKVGQMEPAMSNGTNTQSTENTSPYPVYNGPTVAPVKNVRVIPGYYRVKLKWSKVPCKKNEKVTYKNGKNYTVNEKVVYKIYRNGKYRKTQTKNVWVHYIKVKMYKTYTYKIVAKKTATLTPLTAADGKELTLTKTSTKKKKGQCVRKMRIKIKARSTRYLSSHDGKNKHYTFRAGKTVWSDSYGTGNYYFKKNGGLFRIMRENARAIKADYDTNGPDYSRESANYFINGYVKKNKVAKKKYLIWVSSYHQSAYVFKRVGKNKWKCIDDWDVSMGMKSSPSPTGKKEIHKRIRNRHSIPYWNVYSGAYNALHSRVGDETLGKLASHGCIRNPQDKAKWIWNHCPKGTTVLVY